MARWDTIQVEGQPMRVYLDAPAGGGAAPGIVVIQHGPGLDRFMEDHRIAIIAGVIPPGGVTHIWIFEAKIALGTIGSIGAGWLIYRVQSSQRS